MELSRNEVGYRTLAGGVVPRPIAWTSTLSVDGEENLAPFSFFNVASVTPAVLSIAVTKYDNQKPDRFKDTAANVRETNEFVVNVVTRPWLEKMNATSARLPHGESEWDHADVEQADSVLVDPPRVAGADVAYECKLYDFVPVGKSALLLGEVVYAHVDDEVTSDGKLDVRKLDPLGRLSGGLYAPVESRIHRERPP